MMIKRILAGICASAVAMPLGSAARGQDKAAATPVPQTQPAPPEAPVQAKREAIPPAADRAKAEKLIEEIYSPFPPSTSSGRRDLAGKLLDMGRSSNNDMADRYVLLGEAARMAATSGDVAATQQALEAMGQIFDIDLPGMQLQMFGELKGRLTSPDEHRIAAETALKLADDFAAAARFDEAAGANALAHEFLLAITDPRLAASTRAQIDTIHLMQVEQQRAAEAGKKLAVGDDPESNTTLGRFQCLAQGRWDSGLPKLAKGADPVLRALAKAELSNPETAEAQAGRANDWWSAGERETNPVFRARCKARAARWYSLALADLKGLQRKLAEARLAESPPQPAPDAAKNVAAANSTNPGGQKPAGTTAPPPPPDAPAIIAVTNSTTAAEVPLIVAEIARRYPDVMKGIGQVELMKYHDASELKENYGDHQKMDGAYSEKPATGRGGLIWLWGVYEKWEPGKYIIVYRVKTLAPVTGDGGICFLDVCRGGNTCASRRPLAAEFQDGAWSAMPFPLTLDEATTIEFRFWQDNHELALDRIYVFRIADAK